MTLLLSTIVVLADARQWRCYSFFSVVGHANVLLNEHSGSHELDELQPASAGGDVRYHRTLYNHDTGYL